MSEKPKGIQEGPPVWVESVLSPKEYSECAKKFPNTFTKGLVAVAYNASFHRGGKWRAGMGATSTKEEIAQANKNLEELFKLLKDENKA